MQNFSFFPYKVISIVIFIILQSTCTLGHSTRISRESTVVEALGQALECVTRYVTATESGQWCQEEPRGGSSLNSALPDRQRAQRCAVTWLAMGLSSGQARLSLGISSGCIQICYGLFKKRHVGEIVHIDH